MPHLHRSRSRIRRERLLRHRRRMVRLDRTNVYSHGKEISMKEFNTTLPSGLFVERRIGTETTTDHMYAINEFAFKDMVGTLQELLEQDWGDTISIEVYVNTQGGTKNVEN